MKLFYEAMLDTDEEMEQELAKEGRSYAVYYAKKQVKLKSLSLQNLFYLILMGQKVYLFGFHLH